MDTAFEFPHGKQNGGRREEGVGTKNCVCGPASRWEPQRHLPRLDGEVGATGKGLSPICLNGPMGASKTWATYEETGDPIVLSQWEPGGGTDKQAVIAAPGACTTGWMPALRSIVKILFLPYFCLRVHYLNLDK